MNFLHPGFLWAFSALAIPIVIHLFNFRRYRKVYFSNVRFLDLVQQDARQKSRLKQYLVLATRLLAVAALVLAFAQPYIPVPGQINRSGNPLYVSVFVDNSFSMEAENETGQLLDEARVKAAEIIKSLPENALFQLVSNTFSSAERQFVGSKEFMERLAKLQLSASHRSLDDVLQFQYDLLNEHEADNKMAFLISDFQMNTETVLPQDTGIFLFLSPIRVQQRKNVYVDSCWYQQPVHQSGMVARLMVRLVNASAEAMSQFPVRLYIDHVQKAIGNVDLEPHSRLVMQMNYTHGSAGWHNGRIEIDDFPVTFDNRYYFSTQVKPAIKVLELTQQNGNYMRSLFGSDSLFQYQRQLVSRMDYGQLGQHDFVVINQDESLSSGLKQAIRQFLQQGGNVLLLPSSAPAAANAFLSGLVPLQFETTDSLSVKLQNIQRTHPFFQDVFDREQVDKQRKIDLPTAFKHHRIVHDARADVLLHLQNGDPFLVRSTVEKGALYLLSAPLNEQWTNFSRHALFVPVMYRMAMMSGVDQPLAYPVGTNVAVQADLPLGAQAGDQVVHVQKEGETGGFIPQIRHSGRYTQLWMHSNIQRAGHYQVVDAESQYAKLAFNYDRRESVMTYLNQAELEALARHLHCSLLDGPVKTIHQELTQKTSGKKRWKWFVVMALLFFAAEGALLRLMK